MIKERCFPGFGCGGKGAVWDSQDSGSGAQCYCDCPAGAELHAQDKAEVLARAQVPKSELTAALAEVERLRAENAKLRGAQPVLNDPCPFHSSDCLCGLDGKDT